MIYGNKFLPKKEESISVMEFGIESIVYNEYVNYKGLLESCTDDSSKVVLEAQVNVLYEASIKDILNTIINKIKEFINWIKDIVLEIINSVKEFFSKRKLDRAKELIEHIGSGKKKVGESTFLVENESDYYHFYENFFGNRLYRITNGDTIRVAEAKHCLDMFFDIITYKKIIELTKSAHANIANSGDVDDSYRDSIVEKFIDDIDKIKINPEDVKIEYVRAKNGEFVDIGEAIKSDDLFKNPPKYIYKIKKFVDYLIEVETETENAIKKITDLLEEYKNIETKTMREYEKSFEENYKNDWAGPSGEKAMERNKSAVKAININAASKMVSLGRSTTICCTKFISCLTKAKRFDSVMFCDFLANNNDKLGYFDQEYIDKYNNTKVPE